LQCGRQLYDMHRMLQKRQPPLASFRAATSVAWEELCLWRHERLAAVRLLPQVCIGRRLVGRTCGRPISCAGTPREERSWVALYALRMRTTLWDRCGRRSASRQISCASRKPGRSPLCSSRAAGRARELALPSQRTVRVAVTVGTCSFSPPTVMHLRLLEEAKNFVSARCPRPYLRRDRAHSQRIFATSWLTAATSATRSDVRRCRWRRTRAMM
jgi:hypothetical protein